MLHVPLFMLFNNIWLCNETLTSQHTALRLFFSFVLSPNYVHFPFKLISTAQFGTHHCLVNALTSKNCHNLDLLCDEKLKNYSSIQHLRVPTDKMSMFEEGVFLQNNSCATNYQNGTADFQIDCFVQRNVLQKRIRISVQVTQMN